MRLFASQMRKAEVAQVNHHRTHYVQSEFVLIARLIVEKSSCKIQAGMKGTGWQAIAMTYR